MTGTRKEREAELRELVLAEPRVRAEGDLERARQIHATAVELRAELKAEDERARTIELIRKALNATTYRAGFGELLIVRDELRPIANLGGTEDATLALSYVDELLAMGREIRRLEHDGEDAEVQAAEARFASMTDGLLDLLNDLEAPAAVVRIVEVDANDPDAIEKLIRESGFEQEMRVRLGARLDEAAGMAAWFGFDGYFVCTTCLGELRATTGGWEHVDAAEAADCASARGDEPVGFVFATTELR